MPYEGACSRLLARYVAVRDELKLPTKEVLYGSPTSEKKKNPIRMGHIFPALCEYSGASRVIFLTNSNCI